MGRLLCARNGRGEGERTIGQIREEDVGSWVGRDNEKG